MSEAEGASGLRSNKAFCGAVTASSFTAMSEQNKDKVGFFTGFLMLQPVNDRSCQREIQQQDDYFTISTTDSG